MHNGHGPMNFRRVGDRLANIAVDAFCPGYRRWHMLRWTDWGLEQLETLLAEGGSKPDAHNAAQLALPIMRDARYRSWAYPPGHDIISPVTPNFRDVIDCVLGLPLPTVSELMRRLRSMAEDLAAHCHEQRIVVRAWPTSSDYALISNPRFAMRVLVQGAAIKVRDGVGDSLVTSLRADPDPFPLLERALLPSQGTKRFVAAIRNCQPGHFGEGRRILKSGNRQFQRQRRRVAVPA